MMENITFLSNKLVLSKRKLWSSGRVLGSRLEGRGIDPHTIRTQLFFRKEKKVDVKSVL